MRACNALHKVLLLLLLLLLYSRLIESVGITCKEGAAASENCLS
jgi:hypothetical protein